MNSWSKQTKTSFLSFLAAKLSGKNVSKLFETGKFVYSSIQNHRRNFGPCALWSYNVKTLSISLVVSQARNLEYEKTSILASQQVESYNS